MAEGFENGTASYEEGKRAIVDVDLDDGRKIHLRERNVGDFVNPATGEIDEQFIQAVRDSADRFFPKK